MAKTSGARIKGSVVLFETTDSGDIPLPEGEDDYGTTETGARQLTDAYQQLKELLGDVSEDLGHSLISRAGHGLTSVSIELQMTFSGEANVWVFKAGGEGAVTATLTWDLSEGHER